MEDCWLRNCIKQSSCIIHIPEFLSTARGNDLTLYNGVAYDASFDSLRMDLLELVHGFAALEEGDRWVFHGGNVGGGR